jgi:short-subunit dehydrogenase
MSTVVVTGASTGIGRAIALAWAGGGVTLVLSARNAAHLAEVARAVEARGARAVVVPGDVTVEAHRVELVARSAETGSVDVLVNNAGRGFYAPFEQVGLDELRALFELNVIAPLRLSQLALPHLERAAGTIVMMSSVAGIVAAPKYAAYAASKFALEAISMSMRAELAGRGVRVTVVRPGPVDTPFRANATKGEGVTGYDAPDPKAQAVDDVAAMVMRAARKGTPVVETSAFVRVASTASRLAPWGLRTALRRMASREG